ncbi:MULTISPECIES: YtxH domain-containing protein [unclassified Actinomyces]|uniref:YtxH domain-containing protein n=1 Tax=unclassified Actinomyces TaxID=2609248 RepID=UPI00137394DF|nr:MULTISPECIES: YtxH domain-containing protein [unclassified Actinomyces]MBW3069192.1 YtxH domain-containing protein [Actinomyces sp. 594]NDR53372.1 YtxH domain-containing protein [Actinomyces sp. 565]QHO91884.1 protoporphyrinogen oxidase [Actinomyces sp. 432]
MASKLPFIIGLGAGYVLGTRAGRAQYERIKASATRLVDQPFVRDKVATASTRASSFVREQGEAVTDKVADAVKERLFGTPGPQAAPAPSVTVDDAEVRPVDQPG